MNIDSTNQYSKIFRKPLGSNIITHTQSRFLRKTYSTLPNLGPVMYFYVISPIYIAEFAQNVAYYTSLKIATNVFKKLYPSILFRAASV